MPFLQIKHGLLCSNRSSQPKHYMILDVFLNECKYMAIYAFYIIQFSTSTSILKSKRHPRNTHRNIATKIRFWWAVIKWQWDNVIMQANIYIFWSKQIYGQRRRINCAFSKDSIHNWKTYGYSRYMEQTGIPPLFAYGY